MTPGAKIYKLKGTAVQHQEGKPVSVYVLYVHKKGRGGKNTICAVSQSSASVFSPPTFLSSRETAQVKKEEYHIMIRIK